MSPEDFKKRTFEYAARIARLVIALSGDVAAREIGKQLLRSGMSVGANYRAAARSRSKAEFIAKLGIVEEECDETLYWIDLLAELGFCKASLVSDLRSEGVQILSMVVSSINTARSHLKRSNDQSSKVREEPGSDWESFIHDLPDTDFLSPSAALHTSF